MSEDILECIDRSREEDYVNSLENEEFKQTFKILEENNNHFFITGKAGTGKSTFLKYFMKKTNKKAVVLAPTGLSALNVEGQTIHSFFKFPPRVIESKHVKSVDNNLYKELDALIIDEVSMVRADLMDGVDKFMRRNGKNRNEPFGGVQLILFGDLFQLPPVINKNSRALNYRYETPYFFSANALNKTSIQVIKLENVYRQKDEYFINLLDKIRKGEVDERVLCEINSRVNKNFKNEDDDYVTLTPTNKTANRINIKKLNQLPTRVKFYKAELQGSFNRDKKLPVRQELLLKKGAKVIFVRNDPNKQWVNGSLGRVHRLEPDLITVKLTTGDYVGVQRMTWDKIKYVYDEELDKIMSETIGRMTQFPLKLAWALTIHKSQGQTFNKVFIDLSTRAFTHGQTYVALSRCTSLNGIVLRTPVQPRDVIVDQAVKEFLETKQETLNSV